MALTLPNILSYTAGNPLTAAEMNKMWANDKYLADNVNNGKLVIKSNGAVLNQDFNANSATDVEVNLDIPTKVADLPDAADFARASDVPSSTSQLTNDGADGTHPFITADDVTGLSANNGKLTIKVNGVTEAEFTANQSTDTDIDVTVPQKVSDLGDGGNYYTQSQTNDAINSALAGIAAAKLSYQIVDTLPTADIDTSSVYMILNDDDPKNKYYDQWMYINSNWTHLGTSAVDLSDYVKTSDLPTIPTVNDNTITLQNSAGTTIDSFTLNQATDKTITLPEGGSSKQINLKDADSVTMASFKLNEAADKDVTIPAATDTAYGLCKLVASTTDLEEGTTLDKGTIYGVYDAPISPLIDIIYPVGSIYMSATMSTVEQVQAAFGGTWERWGAGKVPVGVDPNDTDFNEPNKTGGAKTVTLTVEQIPSHKHPEYLEWDNGTEHNGDFFKKSVYGFGSNQKVVSYTHMTDNVGGGKSHNNLQPYITCYMYKRTA